MHVAKLTVLLISALFSQALYAQCEVKTKEVFSCLTEKKKQIEVCDAGQTINYSYGKVGKPEIAIKVPRADASTFQWAGVGSWMSYSVNIPNGKTVYSVSWGVDRMDEKHPIEAGVIATVNGKQVANVKCVESTIRQNLEGINLKPSDI